MIDVRDIRRTPLVVVEWRDATSIGGWRKPPMGREEQCLLTVSVGYLVRRTRRELSLAQTLAADGQISDVLHLPRGMVRRMRRLPVPGGTSPRRRASATVGSGSGTAGAPSTPARGKRSPRRRRKPPRR